MCKIIYEKKRRVTYMSIIFIVETMFDCTICNRQFKSQTGAKLHMKVKHGSKGKSCTTCNLFCHSKAELDRHIETRGNKKYQCKYRDKVFARTWNLKKHVYSIHKGIGFTCKVCGSLFSQKWHLTEHMVIHKLVGFPFHQTFFLFFDGMLNL